MSVASYMTTAIVSVEMDDPLKLVKDIFDNNKFHHLLVVEADKLYGVISDRDLLKVLSPRVGTLAETATDSAALNRKAHQILTREPVTLYSTESIHKAVELFCQNNVSCIPIIDDSHKPVGILSWRDVFKVMAETQRKRELSRQST